MRLTSAEWEARVKAYNKDIKKPERFASPAINASVAAELDQPETLWWLSFAGGEDGKNLGIAIVRARGFVTAIHQTHVLSINPGGSVKGCACPELEHLIDAMHQNRFIPREEAIGYSRWIDEQMVDYTGANEELA